MAELTQTTSVYDVPGNLLALLGSLWTETYSGRVQVADYVAGKCQIEQQAMFDLLELIASMSRFDVPIYHRENWYPLVLKESERNTASVAVIKYDDGHAYDTGLTYDQIVSHGRFAFPKPATLADADVIVDRFVAPTFMAIGNIDFVVSDDAILFTRDPLTDHRLQLREIFDDSGDLVDREALLWLYRGSFDWQHIYKQFGYALGLQLKSSRGYRDVMNAFFDAILCSSTSQTLRFALSAITGIPLVREAIETVEVIAADRRHRLIITDKHVYKFAREATAIVSVGDTVRRGDFLTDALEVIVPSRGEIPASLEYLSLGKGMLTACFTSDLVFENREVPLTVITDDPSGYTKLTWPLGGDSRDVAKFFDELHARGILAAQANVPSACDDSIFIITPGDGCDTETTYAGAGTLAHLLDNRTNRVGEPTAVNLPRTINPLQFVAEHVLRHHAAIVRLSTRQTGLTGIGVHNLRLLQRLVPPRAYLFIVLNLEMPAEIVNASEFTEAISFFHMLAPLADQISTDMVRDGYPVFRQVT